MCEMGANILPISEGSWVEKIRGCVQALVQVKTWSWPVSWLAFVLRKGLCSGPAG